MITKTIDIGGIKETFRCTGRTPRIYRDLINRDMLLDMQTFTDAQAEATETNEQVSAETMDSFYDMAYVMAYHAAMAEGRLKDFPSTVEDWIDQFPMLPLMQSVADIFELWTSSNASIAVEKNV